MSLSAPDTADEDHRNPRLQRAGFGFHKKDDVRRMTDLLAKSRVDGEVYMFPQVRGDFPGFTSAE